jgi:hypothetical protein
VALLMTVSILLVLNTSVTFMTRLSCGVTVWRS